MFIKESTVEVSLIFKVPLFVNSVLIVELANVIVPAFSILFILPPLGVDTITLVRFIVPASFLIAISLSANTTLVIFATAFSLLLFRASELFCIVRLFIFIVVSFCKSKPLNPAISIMLLFALVLKPFTLNIPAPVTPSATFSVTVYALLKLYVLGVRFDMFTMCNVSSVTFDRTILSATSFKKIPIAPIKSSLETTYSVPSAFR